jgi:hypothetical protein
MMMTEMDIETSVYYVHLTRLIAREDYIKIVGKVFFFFSGTAGVGLEECLRKGGGHIKDVVFKN